MAISNVRSSAYRSAGGRAWNRVKGTRNTISWDGPVPGYVTEQRNRTMDENDKNYMDKARVREQLETEGYDESLVTVIPAGKSGKKRKGAKR